MSEPGFEGKKIFFFYPPTWLKEELVQELIENEYEAYVMEDHRVLFPLLKTCGEALLFINVDSGPRKSEWEKYLRVINESEFKDRIRIGILSSDNTKEAIAKYIGELRVNAGYIILKQRTHDIGKSIYGVLEKTGAKGRRKYLRAVCDESVQALFNLQIGEAKWEGRILDISSVGMACVFNDDRVILNAHDKVPDIMLRLSGKIMRVSGWVAGIRHDEQRTFVIMFDERTPPAAKEKIHSFIIRTLELNMQKAFKEKASENPT